MTIRKHPVRGYLYIALATLLWGLAASLGRAVFTGRLPLTGEALHPIAPLILAQSRTSLSLLVLLPVLWLRRGGRALALPAGDVGRAFLLGTLGVAASNYLYYLAIQKTSVATAIILQYTAPVWVLLYMIGKGRQRATLRRIGAVGLAGVGSSLAIGALGSGLRLNLVGVVAALLAAFSFAFYNVAGHSLLERYDRFKVLLWTLMGAALFWIILNPPWKIVAAHYTREQWLFLAAFSVLSVLAPFSCYFAGLQHLEPTSAIVASCLEPVFSILIAAISLGEVVRPVQGLGIVVVLAAIVLVQMPDRRTHEVLTVVEPME